MAFKQKWDLPSLEQFVSEGGASSLSGDNRYFARVEKYLKGAFSSPEIFIENTRFIELLLGSRNGFLLDYISDLEDFYNFTAFCLHTIPLDSWDNKGSVITDLFQRLKYNASWEMLFCSSTDPKTREIGVCFKKGLDPDTPPTERARCFRRMQELMPHMFDYHFRVLFGYLHLPLDYRSTFYKDLPCIRHLTFNVDKEIITHKDLIIGRSRQEGIGESLTAYEESSGHLIWEVRLDKLFFRTRDQRINLSCCQKTPFGLSLMHEGNPNLIFINLEQGTIDKRIALPGPAMDIFYSGMHISPSGFAYYQTILHGEHVLLGGEISETWGTRFKRSPPRNFIPLDHFICFPDRRNSKHTVLDSMGNMHELSCLDVRIKNGKLYTLEKREGKGYCVHMQLLGQDKAIFSLIGLKSSIDMDDSMDEFITRFMDICENGIVICSSGYRREALYFVDYEQRKIVKIKHEFSTAKIFIDVKRCVVWSWDYCDKALWMHTPSESKKIGPLEGSSSMDLVHIDHENRLCLNNCF
jgi:hypothetical protein